MSLKPSTRTLSDTLLRTVQLVNRRLSVSRVLCQKSKSPIIQPSPLRRSVVPVVQPLERPDPRTTRRVILKASAVARKIYVPPITVSPIDSVTSQDTMVGNPLTYDDGPLVWVDCEMTGLDVENDRIIEIAVIITNGNLDPVDEGIEYIIQTPKEVLDAMDEWCTNQHGKSGLTAGCIASPHTYEEVTQKVVEYIQHWIPEKGAGLLAGSSVHADMRFLLKGMPEVMKHLSYRIVDVSSVKELCKRWYPAVRAREQSSRTGESSHRALDDIRASIRELKFYRESIFIGPESPDQEHKTEETAQVSEPRKTAL